MPTPADGHGSGLRAPGAVTELLQEWHAGSELARNRLFEMTYAELRAIAGGYLRRERRDGSVQVTALVHEAFLRLVGTRASWADRSHFYGVAAQAMRRVLVDHARRRQALKRNGGQIQLSLNDATDLTDRDAMSALKVDEALSDLERLDARQARIVELRYFAGLSVDEAADALQVSPTTVKREWATARAWLARRTHTREEVI
ncbi:MAG: ECF-type sigma factor [Vicinamibacteria bacterium]